MRDTDRHTGQPSHRFNKGFISAYFLAVFLFLSLYAAIAADNVRNRSLTVLNLKREQEYYMAEFPRIREVMCRLQEEKNRQDTAAEENEEGDEDTIGEQSEETPLTEGNTIILTVSGPLMEEVMLSIDPQTGKVIDYTPLRNEESNDS